MQKIGIIGAGFMGTMIANHLVSKATTPIQIDIFNDNKSIGKGIAYKPYSKKHLLNVITSKMSAYADQNEHFLDWVMNHEDYKEKNRDLVSAAFLPRNLYGDYLSDIWSQTIQMAKDKKILLNQHITVVTNITKSKKQWNIISNEKANCIVDKCILASGNVAPRNPKIKNLSFFESENYFQNPWNKDSIANLKNDFPILIIGNGLTMVDTVLGLMEQGFDQAIYSISPNGFNILPHRNSGVSYPNMANELPKNATLLQLVSLFNRHIKSVRQLGLTAEPIIDSLRSYTQEIWRNLSDDDKSKFMTRLRHLWGVARHRIPLHIHDKIQHLRIHRKLNVISGSIIDIYENTKSIKVDFKDHKTKQIKSIIVSRVINCTGPETAIELMEPYYLTQMFSNGLITQDNLKLGIKANIENYHAIDSTGQDIENLYIVGSLLKGELWESTAINELKLQAEKISKIIL